jgi:hypothetical protein
MDVGVGAVMYTARRSCLGFLRRSPVTHLPPLFVAGGLIETFGGLLLQLGNESIAIFTLVFQAQALEGVTIQVVLIFAFGNNEVFETTSFVHKFPCVAEVAWPAGTRGMRNISYIRIADRLAMRAGEHGDVADLAVAVESNDGVLIALVVGEGPNLLAFILGLELANFIQARVRLRIRHAQAEPENLRSRLTGGGERSDAKK